MKEGLIKQLTRNLKVLLLVFILPGLSFGQNPPPLPGGGNGGVPDSPLAVPFDSHMALLLMLAGVMFAISVILKLQKNNRVEGITKIN